MAHQRCQLGVLLLSIVALAAAAQAASTTGPVYYIQAELVEWNYVPSGLNLCHHPGGQNITEGSKDALYATDALGSTYYKGMYVEYTDANFTTRVERPENETYLGILGPVIRAVAGQSITVHLRNTLPFNVSILPTGGLKQLPSAAPDSGDLSTPYEMQVTTNETGTYNWLVPPLAAPAAGEPNAKLWLYSPAHNEAELQNTGLMGPILIYPDEEALNDGKQDVITVWTIFKEQESYLWNMNLANRTLEDLGLESTDDLDLATLRTNVNGFMFCNLPHPQLTVGESARWHLGSFGSEDGAHGIHFHGMTFLNMNQRTDAIKLMPGTAVSVGVDPDVPGTWLLHCHINSHLAAGMIALFDVLPAATGAPAPAPAASSGGVERVFYLAAELVEWNYVPLGGDACPEAAYSINGDGSTASIVSSSSNSTNMTSLVRPFTDDQNQYIGTDLEAGLLGSTLLKARFIEYTDETFTTLKPRPESEEYLGVLGPVFRAEVGDSIKVVFVNRLSYPASVHPHGVAYEKEFEGAPYNDGLPAQPGDAVAPGTNFTYLWTVPERAGPGPADPSTIVWLYHSHANEITDTYAGLSGGLVIGRKGDVNKTTLFGSDVDHEFVLMFGTLHEMESLVWPENEALIYQESGSNVSTLTATADAETAFTTAYSRHAINGFMFCNMPGLTFKAGDRVRFHTLALGTDVDLYSPFLDNNVWRSAGTVAQSFFMFAGGMHTVDVIFTEVGRGTLRTKVLEHLEAGMITSYTVLPGNVSAITANRSADVPTVYVQSEEHVWIYAPQGHDVCSMTTWGTGQAVYTSATNATIGPACIKGLYRQYLDSNFTVKAPRPKSSGFIGPTFTLEVGQTFQVVYRNTLDFDNSLAFVGGLVVADGSDDPLAPVAPGETATYRYVVPASMGPGENDLSTVVYSYGSGVDPIIHPYSGLVGMMLVGQPGAFRREDGSSGNTSTGMQPIVDAVPADVDVSAPLLFFISNENLSPYLLRNLAARGLPAGLSNLTDPDAADAFNESNLKHSVNGYLWCNMPPLATSAGQLVRVSLLTLGGVADMHAPVFKGQVIQNMEQRTQVSELMPAITHSIDLHTTQPGTWEFYCGIHDHWEAGMRAQIQVSGDSAASEVTLAGTPVSSAWRVGNSGFGPAATALLAAALAALLLLLTASERD